MTIANSNFLNNKGYNAGAIGIFNPLDDCYISFTTFKDNSVINYAGALFY